MQRAVTAIYRTHAVAELVRDEIAELGISRGHIHVVPDSDESLETGTTRDTSSFNDDLHGLHLPEDEMRTYQEAVRRGDHVVSVNVDDDAHLDRIMEIMRRPEDSYDIDALDEEYRDAEYVPATAAGAGTGAATTGALGAGAAPAAHDADHRPESERGMAAEGTSEGVMGSTTGMETTSGEEVIPVAEERLHVGKRDAGRGSVHVRAYTREVPVEERVTLRDEHVHVERRAPSGTVPAEAAFEDREVVMEEHDEEAVVTKEAEVVEEVVVRKDADVREEVVSDTVRKTEIDVDGENR